MLKIREGKNTTITLFIVQYNVENDNAENKSGLEP